MDEITNREAARARAELGAALLDEREPEWLARMWPETLNVATVSDCVLAQATGTGNYFSGVGRLGLMYENCADYGFTGRGVGEVDWDTDARCLTQAWRELISARRASL